MSFAFTKNNLEKAQAFIAKYPAGRQASSVLALLDLAQRQNNGHLSNEAIQYVAEFLKMSPIRVHEVASFYTMFNLKPVGKHHIQVCTTTPCWLRGAGDVLNKCCEVLKIDVKATTEDGKFTLNETECLGACINAPVVRINDDYYEDVTPAGIQKIIAGLGKSTSHANHKRKKI